MSRRILMVAFHYPPAQGSSGLQRSLQFSRHLPNHGWDPVVLSAHPRAHRKVGEDQLAAIPPSVPVTRAFGLDTARHLAFRGSYPSWLALPDRWVTWALGAIPAGLRLISEFQPRFLWSTYPIATAHLIAYALHRISGVPWICDFRDPMLEIDARDGRRYPGDPALWKARHWVERRTAAYASKVLFVTHGALNIYRERYAELPATRLDVVPNGFDEDDFVEAQRLCKGPQVRSERTVLLHSGVLYPGPDRDPGSFFKALSILKQRGKISTANLRVVLRASGYEQRYSAQAAECGVDDIVAFQPAIPYREALAEMLDVDGLLIFQGYTSNPAIPAKAYEYIRAGRPILGMVDSEGETAALLRRLSVARVVPMDSEQEIAQGLSRYLDEIRSDAFERPGVEETRIYSREQATAQFATILDRMAE